MSLRNRLISAFALVTLLAIAAVEIASNAAASNSLTRSALVVLRGQADTQAHLLGTHLDGEIATLQAFSLNATLQNRVDTANTLLPAQSEQALAKALELDTRWKGVRDDDALILLALTNSAAEDLKQYQSLHSQCAELILTDRIGGLVAASVRTSDYYQGDEDWWKAVWNATDHAPLITQPFYDETIGDQVMRVVVPVYGHESREVIGVLAASCRLSELVAPLQETELGQTGRATLLLPGDLMIGADNTIGPIDAAVKAELDALSAAPDHAGQLQGAQRFAVQVPIETSESMRQLGWRVLIDQRADEVLAPVAAATQALVISGVIVLLLTLIPAFALAQLIAAPLRSAAQAASQIAAGDLTQRIESHRSGELGQLAESFNAMASALEQRIAAEQAANAERLQLQSAVIEAQEATLRELSTPLIPLASDVLLLPLIGAVDSRRAEQIIRTLLEEVSASRARMVILDLTGVAVVDTQVGQALVRAAQGARLLGAEVVLAGIRAEVAQTIVGLGIDLTSFEVQGDLQTAIARMLENRT